MITIKKIPCELTWNIRQIVMWPNMPLDYVKLPEDAQAIHYGLFIETKLVSIVSLCIASDRKTAQFRKFATLNAYQGRGYGSQLLNHLMNAVLKLKLTTLWCNARFEKTAFYEKFGLKKTNQKFSKNGISYIIMEKILS